MTLDGFLTALALAAAIYSVVPPIQRIHAQLALWLQVPAALTACGFVLYLEYFKYVGVTCHLPSSAACDILTLKVEEAKDAAFLVVIAWMFVAWLIHRTARSGLGALIPIRRIVDELSYERRYAELAGFIQPHLQFIAAASRRQLALQLLADQLEKWRERYTDAGDWRTLLHHEEEKPDTGWAIWRRLLPAVGWLGSWVPSQKKAEEAANDIVRILLETQGLQCFIWDIRPYFGINLLEMNNFRSADYCFTYLTGLIERPMGILYFELEHNQNLAKGRRYALPPRNRLLHYLLSDARRAENLSVWKPIGDHALRVLRPDGDKAYLARLNQAPHEFDIERYKDPLCATVSFFNIMVMEAAFQGVRWHMWLYYFPDIMRDLVSNYDDSSDDIDPDDEFPTLGCRIIYEMFDAMGGWASMVTDLPEDSPHRNVQLGLQGDNGNIPKSAALALGRSLVHVVMSDSLSPRFIRYMVECVARDIRDLYAEGPAGPMRAALVEAVANGGSSWSKRGYAGRLLSILSQLDFILVGEVKDLVAAIEQVIAKEADSAG